MQVQLPKTDFPMKGNLATTEPARIEAWLKDGVYNQMMERPAPRGHYIFSDGPPYANGNLHVGHALNKILKDIIVKYRNLRGYKAAFIPGWDCHGLPIELNVTKKLGPKRKELSDREVRDLCRTEAKSWVEKQKTQFQRLGVIADWDHPYLTLKPAYEADQVRLLAEINDHGIFYRGEKPVYWDTALQTALAASEVEYRPHKSLSVYVKFPYEAKRADLPAKPISFLIWTTTPWTLPANYGLTLHANFDYGFYDAGDDILIVAEGLKEAVEKETGLSLKLVASVKGAELERQKAKHPFLPRESLVMLGDHVTLEAGTGVVHTAPGHGLDDYIVGLRYGLPVSSPVDGAGRYTDEVPLWAGMKIAEASPKIAEYLREQGKLVAMREFEHSYPHSPRSKAPLIFRATPQWFIRMDDETYKLRARCLEIAENKLRFVPEWGKARLKSMLENTPDWCLSRQRIWGVPIPVYYCTKCQHPLVKSAVMRRLADAMESSGEGLETYYAHPPAEFTQGEACEKCKHTEFTVGRDIMDVWFDSGAQHTAVQKRRPESGFPADIYLEGSDQHRGWFLSSLMSSVAAYGEAPYRALITHGFVNDAQGYKMSKSLGNVVDPAEIVKDSGAEILRLWVGHEDFGDDLSISKEKINRLADTYRRFRNTIRFLLGNLNDFDPAKDLVEYPRLSPLDQWALNQLAGLIERCTHAYDNYEFHKVYHALNTFIAHDLSATYLDILKDRLYTGKVDGVLRRGSQTVLLEITRALTGLLAPIASFLAEETYGYLPGQKKTSVFLSDFPEAPAQWKNPQVEAEFARLLEVRAVVSPKLEDLRRQKAIGSSLDAAIRITAPEMTAKTLEAHRGSLREFFIVSQVEVQAGAEFAIEATSAAGTKCERCWYYDPETGRDARFPTFCSKCVAALT